MMSVPSTIVLVPLSNLTVTPGSTVKKTPTRTKTSAVAVYGLPDNVQVVLVVIPPPTSVPEYSKADTNEGPMFNLQDEQLTASNINVKKTAFFSNLPLLPKLSISQLTFVVNLLYNCMRSARYVLNLVFRDSLLRISKIPTPRKKKSPTIRRAGRTGWAIDTYPES